MDKNPGYVFALINPSLEGLVRIEVTKGDPQDGARDLSTASGTTDAFIVLFQQHFTDCQEAVNFVQNTLAEFRSPNQPGYFRVPNTEAVLAILRAKNALEAAAGDEAVAGPDPLEDTAKTNRRKFCSQLLTEGRKFQYGDAAVPRDQAEAIRLFQKAIDMHCPDAHRMMGTLHYDRYVFITSAKSDLHEALKHYQDGIAMGNTRCWGDAARCYEKMKDYRNAEKCWLNFWTLVKDQLDPESRAFYSDRFQEYMLSAVRSEHRKSTQALAGRVGSTFAELPEGKNDRLLQEKFGIETGG